MAAVMAGAPARGGITRAAPGRRWLALALCALLVAGAVLVLAPSAGAALTQGPMRFWGPNVAYSGDATTAKKVNAMVLLNGTLYVGGNFDQVRPELDTTALIAGVKQPFLYAVDATTGVLRPQFAPVLNGPVEALEVDPVTGSLYVGGTFTTVNGQPVTGLAVLDPVTGALVGTQRPIANTGGAPGVYALHRVDRRLYVGGQFTSIGGAARGQVASLAIDASNGVEAFQSNVMGGKVLAIDTDGTKLILAGEFSGLKLLPTDVDAVPGTAWLAAVDLVTGATVPTFVTNVPCSGSCSNPTRGRSLAVANGLVFAAFGGGGGRFAVHRASDGAQLAAWRTNGDVQAVATAANRVFVGGHFENISSLANVARCQLFSATFGDATNLNLQLQPDPDLQSVAHLGAFSVLAPSATDTYWAGQFTKLLPPATDNPDCSMGTQTANYSPILRLVDGPAPTDTGAPTVPQNAQWTSDGTSVTLTWSPSTDDTAVTAYEVVINGVTRRVVPGPLTSVTLTAADGITDPAAPPSLRLQALDPFGQRSAKSPVATAPPSSTTTTTTVPQPAADRAGEFTPTAEPFRIVDTRVGTGGSLEPLRAGQPRSIQITGQGGVPSSGVAMVAMNVTVVGTTAAGFLTVHPTGTDVPTVSNLNFRAGQTVPNLVLARVGLGGKVDVVLSAGSTNLLIDVVGWVADASSPTPASRTKAVAPGRVLDTRTGLGRPAPGPVGQGQTIEVQVVAPGQNIRGVIVNLTGVLPTAPTFVTAYPADVATRPTASNLNLLPGEARPNLAMVAVSPAGTIKLYNDTGSVHLLADVVGYFEPVAGPSPSTTGRIVALGVPDRIVDTRATSPLGTDDTRTLAFPQLGAVAAGAPVAGVIANATAVQPTAPTFLTVFPGGTQRPTTSSLNAAARTDVPNLVLTAVGTGATISVYNSVGSVHYLLDAAAVVLG